MDDHWWNQIHENLDQLLENSTILCSACTRSLSATVHLTEPFHSATLNLMRSSNLLAKVDLGKSHLTTPTRQDDVDQLMPSQHHSTLHSRSPSHPMIFGRPPLETILPQAQASTLKWSNNRASSLTCKSFRFYDNAGHDLTAGGKAINLASAIRGRHMTG